VGETVSDRICVSEGAQCADNFSFINVFSTIDLDSRISGVVGLTLGLQAATSSDFSVGNLLLNGLYASSSINLKTFATHFGTINFLDFSVPSTIADKVTIKMREGFFWSAEVNAIRLSTLSSSDEFTYDSLIALFSTSSAISLVPGLIATAFFERMLKGIDH
jgi:hypothetical protein